MGANVSTTVEKAIQETEQITKLECDMSNVVDQEIKNVKITLRGASCDNIRVGNRATVQAKCDLDAISASLAKKATSLTEEQKANLGTLNVSTDVSETEQRIKNILEAKCGSKTKIDQAVDGVNLEILDDASCKLIDVYNESDAATSCIAKAVNDTIMENERKKKLIQKGMNPLDVLNNLIGGYTAIVITVIVGCVLCSIASIVLSVVMGQSEAGQEAIKSATEVGKNVVASKIGGGNFKKQQIPLIVLILGVLFLYFTK